MRKILLYMIAIVLLSIFSSAADVGVVVELADSTEYTDCVEITDGESAYDAFQETTLDMVWQNYGFGYFLDEVEGVASGDITGHYWSFWHINSVEDDFEAAMVGASDYIITGDGTVIGISYTDYDLSFNPITKPNFYDYENLCPYPLKIRKVTAYVDDDKDTLSEGEEIKVKPGSELELIVKVSNEHDSEDLEDVEIEFVIEDIDDGDDMEEDDNGVDIRDDDSEELTVVFDIPNDADEDTYDMTLTVTGELNGVEYTRILHYEVEVDKNKHELEVDVVNEEHVECGSTFLFRVELDNIGKDDEEGTIKIRSADLGIDTFRSFEIDEDDSDTRQFTLRVPQDAKGAYTMRTTITYGNEIDEYTTMLRVDCPDSFEVDMPVKEVSEPVFQQVTAAATADTDESFDFIKENGYIILLILGNIILVAVIMFVFMR